MPRSDVSTIEALHAAPCRLVLAVTGGGSGIISDLLQVPGASGTVLEAVVPYSPESMAEWIGRQPEQFCSRSTALRMATVAWHRAKQLSESMDCDADECFGVACTASLASVPAKRGEHRCWIAVESSRGTWIRSATLAKGQRDRAEEETIVADMILSAICEATDTTPFAVTGTLPDDILTNECARLPELLQSVRNGDSLIAWSQPDGNLTPTISDDDRPVGVLCGSFDPLHEGHREMQSIAESLLGGPVCFELTVRNADKPPLDAASIESRRKQFQDSQLALTGAPRFVDKTVIFPGATFVIGFDTAARIIEPRFYGGSLAATRQALQHIRDAGCRFLVAGRLSGGEFGTLEQLNIPEDFQDLFDAIPESQFRRDISSTQLRQSAAD